MALQVYAVVLDNIPDAHQDNAKVRDLILKHYPENYRFCDNVYFIRTKNTNISTVTRLVGIVTEDKEVGVNGVVLRLTPHFAGYAGMDLWEWLDDAHGANT